MQHAQMGKLFHLGNIDLQNTGLRLRQDIALYHQHCKLPDLVLGLGSELGQDSELGLDLVLGPVLVVCNLRFWPVGIPQNHCAPTGKWILQGSTGRQHTAPRSRGTAPNLPHCRTEARAALEQELVLASVLVEAPAMAAPEKALAMVAQAALARVVARELAPALAAPAATASALVKVSGTAESEPVKASGTARGWAKARDPRSNTKQARHCLHPVCKWGLPLN